MKMNKSSLFKKILLTFQILLFSFLPHINSFGGELNKNLRLISIGENDAPVIIKIYSSYTCSHCANFHINVVSKIKEKYVKTGKVKIVFMDFPLDLAALSASKMLRCVEKKKQMLVMDLIYKNQKEWVVGSTIDEINNNLKKILTTSGIKPNKIDKCFIDENIEDIVLKIRIEGHKKYSINSTPTIIINEKKISDSDNFENIDKIIKNII